MFLRMPNKFDIDPDYCPEEFLEIARNELRETPEVREEATKKLKELLLETKDLYYGIDDDFLVIFLRPCKWYPESALQLVSIIKRLSLKKIIVPICKVY